MKILGYEIDIIKVNNVDVKKPDRGDIRRAITIPTQLYRTKQDILSWREALKSAESITNPQRYNLYRLYKEIITDAHISSCIEQRKNLTKSLDYDVVDKDGNENEDLEKVIEAKWFLDFVDMALDSKFYGHSLIQFESVIDNSFKCVELVPREYVKPEKHIVTSSYSAIDGTDYLLPPYNNWVIGVGDSCDLGLLMKAAPLYIWKKNALAAWAEYAEVFGTPLRIGKTNVRDEETRANMEAMLQGMKSAAYGVFDTEDSIELVETNKVDAHKVFDEMIKRCNSELSKLFLGQTATMDEQSFVGTAEVQERVLEKVGYSDQYFIENVINTQLLPMMTRLGIWQEGYKIKVAKDNEFTLQEKAKFDIDLLNTGKYTFDPEYLLDNYGSEAIPVIEQNTVGAVKNSLSKYYNK